MSDVFLWTLRKKYPYCELCWSLFSRNRTEYGDILHISPYSVQIRENTDQNNSKYGHFLRSGNQYKYIAFNILLCSILIISYKTLNITWIYNEKTKELTIYAIFYQNVTIFYRQELASLFQKQEKLKPFGNSKWKFSSSCFIADDNHLKIVGLHVVVLTEHDILHVWDNLCLLKWYPAKFIKLLYFFL